MFTAAEKTSLALTVSFLLLGAGLKTWQRHQVRLGPFQDGERGVLETAAAGGGSPEARVPDSPSAVTGRPVPVAADFSEASGAAETGAGQEGPGPGKVGRHLSASSPPPPPPPSGRGEEPGRKTGAESRSRPGKKGPPPGKVSLNRASAAELAEIPGIGAKTALAILAYRKSHGEFLDLKELVHVKGIGEKKLERIAPYLAISPERAEEPLRQARLPEGAEPD